MNLEHPNSGQKTDRMFVVKRLSIKNTFQMNQTWIFLLNKWLDIHNNVHSRACGIIFRDL